MGFKHGHMCKRETELQYITSLPNMNIDHCPCFNKVSQAVENYLEVFQDETTDAKLLETVQGMFDRGIDEGEEVESQRLTCMEEVLQTLDESEHVLSKPPEDFNIH